MATRAIIAVGDIKCKGILLYSDGYPSHALDILNSYYTSIDSVNELIQGGDIKCLYKKYKPNPLGIHNYKYRQPNVTLVLNRDIKYSEDNNYTVFDINNIKNITKFSYYDYIYLHKDGEWIQYE